MHTTINNNGSVVDRFEEEVKKHPNSLAFKTTKDELTWDALNRAANRVARAILDVSGNRKIPVGLLLDREASLMIATMGVLKTGGFYVPLSPSHPSARIGYILKETEAALLVTDEKGWPVATEVAPKNCRLLKIEALDAPLSSDNLGLSIPPDSLTSITYTSGSTGEPKGVINTHRRDLHRTVHDAQFGLGSEDRFTNVGSAERRSPLTPLLSGAASFPWYAREEGLARLSEWLIREEITVLRAGPRVFRHFVAGLTGREDFSKLRVINLAGEPVYRSDVDLYKKHFSPNCVMVNTYGAHEVGPIRLYVINKKAEVSSDKVPVGYQIPDKEVLILDEQGRHAGFYQVGQIAVRSRYLSRGYWRRSDLTKERFLEDSEGSEDRVYLTGDLGRMLPDGCLEHHGRQDFQVKIRGLRVEITEVEQTLRDMAAIREAAVVAREDKPGDNRLVAYIVPHVNATLNASVARKWVEQKLPPHMVPSRFVILESLPLTPTGKVNRASLPDPGRARPELETPFLAPQTEVERQLAQIWREVLGLGLIGIHDSFIELGGHSLLAAKVISQINQIFGVELSLPSLFEHPTISELALVIYRSQIQNPTQERLLSELEHLSDEEAERLLAEALPQKLGHP